MKRTISTGSILLTLALTVPAWGDLIDITWIGPDGENWHTALHWDPATVPNNGGGNEYHAIISTRFGNLVNLDSNTTVSRLTVGTGDHLHINPSRHLTVSALDEAGGVIDNAGLIELGSTGGTTAIRPTDGVVSLTGGGTILMGNNANNWIYRNSADGALINVDNTIEGAGQLSWNSAPTPITNQHLIIANQSTALTIQPGSALFTNEGTLRAADGGTLRLGTGTYDNTGGIIEALADSLVTFEGNAFITGGTLDTNGDGLFRVVSGTSHIDNLTHGGHTIIDNGLSLLASGAIHNTGLIELDSAGGTTGIRPTDGVVSLTGGGTILMGNHPNNWIFRNSADGALINVDNTIEGAGQLSWTGTPTPITNQHLIIANQTEALAIQPGSALFTNEGALRAADGGTLRLGTGTYDNTGGLIEARAGSQIHLSGNAFITGGTLDTQGDGLFLVTFATPHVDNLTHAGHTIIENSRIMLGSGTINNTGLIELGSTGGSTYLRPTEGTLTLTGGGTIRLSDSANNWIYRHTTNAALLNVDNVIEGAGNLSWSGSPTPITNQHLIIANQTAPLTIQPGSALFTNEGTLRAEDGGTLQLNGGTYDNNDGLIQADAGSVVHLNGNATITGGTLDTEGDGRIRVTANTPLIGDLTHAGHTTVNNGRTMFASGTITNTGTIELESTGGNTYLRPADGPVTLTGGGTVVLSDTTTNWMYRADANSYWINHDNTVRGAGNLSWVGSRTGWINHGSIIADGENLLDIAPDNDIGLINHGLLHAENIGGLGISGGMMNQQGTVLIDAGSMLTRSSGHFVQTDGITTVNGTMAVTGGGNQLQLQGGVLNGTGQITGTLNNTGGSIEPGESLGTLHVQGTLMQSGSGTLVIEIDDELNHDLITVSGSANLGGVLDLQISEDFNPLPNTEIVFLEAGSITGTFDQFLPCDGSKLRIIYDAGEGTVAVRFTESKTGDLDCSSAVGVPDLLLLLAAWGDCNDPETCPADLDENGSVGVPDLLILLANWG